MSRKKLKIPGSTEWNGYETDLDVRYAHKLIFGKSLDDAQEHFGGVQSISRADELLRMPRGAFQYYVLAFAQFVTSDAACQDADSASSFLRLLINRERRDPGSFAEIYDQLVSAMEFVAARQEYFDASTDIYGSFADLAAELKAADGLEDKHACKVSE